MTTLTLDIAGPKGKVPAASLVTILDASLKSLEDLRASMTPSEEVTWYVTDLRVDSAVAVLTADSLSEAPQRVGIQFVRGLAELEHGAGLPAFFPDRALNRVGRMGQPLGVADVGRLRVAIGTDGQQEAVDVTRAISDNIKQLRWPKSRAVGSITGALDTISLRRKKPRFQVLDPVSRRPVVCDFGADQISAVKDALGRRVTVAGTIVRNSSGQPLRVEEPTFQVLPPSRALSDLVGIDPSFTGGRSLDDYLRLVRTW